MERRSSTGNILHTNTRDRDTLEVLSVQTRYFTRGGWGAVFVLDNLSSRCQPPVFSWPGNIIVGCPSR